MLEKALSDKAVADRAAVAAAVEGGATPEEAVAPCLEDAVFDAWLADLTAKLEAAIA